MIYILEQVLLLAETFECFREMSLQYYNLLPGMAWNALLIMTGIELELLTDIDFHLFFESNV